MENIILFVFLFSHNNFVIFLFFIFFQIKRVKQGICGSLVTIWLTKFGPKITFAISKLDLMHLVKNLQIVLFGSYYPIPWLLPFFFKPSDGWWLGLLSYYPIAKKKVYSESEPNTHFKKDELTLQIAVVGHNLFSHITLISIKLDCRENCLSFFVCILWAWYMIINGFVFDYLGCCLLLLLSSSFPSFLFLFFFPHIFSIKRVIKIVFF